MAQVSPAILSDLAPTGTLRVGINHGNLVLAQKNATTGEVKGVAVDLAHELGRRLGVPVQLVQSVSAGAFPFDAGAVVTFTLSSTP